MDSNRLYEKAFEWKTLKPWTRINEDQFFSAELNGELCYLQVLGDDDDAYVLAVFPGEEGRKSCLRFQDAMQKRDDLEILAAVHGLRALQCHFCRKDFLQPGEEETIREYTKAHGIPLRGKNAWPSLVSFAPHLIPERIADPDEEEILSEALDLSIWLIRNMEAEGIRIPSITEKTETILCFQKDGDRYAVKEIPIDVLPQEEYPVGQTENEICREKVKRLRKKGKWACELMSLSVPSPAEGFERMVYPWLLITAELKSGKPVEVQPVRDYERRTNVMLDKLMEAMIRENVCPSEITVPDDRTYALLRDWCPEMGIRLRKGEKPEIIRELELECGGIVDEPEDEAEMDSLLELVRMLPDEVLLSDPRMLKEGKKACRELVEAPDIGEPLRRSFRELLDRLESLERAQTGVKSGKRSGNGKKAATRNRPATPEKSFVISVSLESGCYRHIQISNHALLSDLSDEILDAFGFVDDHAHGFFMDNRAYSYRNCFYKPGIDAYAPTTDSFTLEDAGVCTGLKFKYVFDFGEDWTFQCRVLKELEIKTKVPLVVRSKGNAPEQYPDWSWEYDDDEDDDEDE